MALPLVTPGEYDMVVYQGATWERVFNWQQANEDPIVITGCTAEMDVRIVDLASTTVLELSTANSRIVLDELNGQISMFLSAEETAAVRALTYVYDLEITDPAPDPPVVVRLLQGEFDVRGEVTRDDT